MLSAGGETRVGIITVKLPRRDATVSVIAYNKNGPSAPASVQIVWAGRGTEPKPKLYILAIGVDAYKDETLKLRYPGKDAADFVETGKQHEVGLYENVITASPPKDGRWTHDAVLDGLDWIKKAPTNQDVALIFISGHGVVTPDQVYRFLPYDYDADKIERTTVRSLDFQDFLSKIGGKVLVFLDTCYSGDIFHGGKAPLHTGLDKIANELAAAENGAVVFASSTGNQLSWEDPPGAMARHQGPHRGQRKADVKRRCRAGSALEDYVYDRVKRLTDGKQKPMVAKPKMISLPCRSDREISHTCAPIIASDCSGPCALAIHADRDRVVLQGAGEVVFGELKLNDITSAATLNRAAIGRVSNTGQKVSRVIRVRSARGCHAEVRG